MVSGGRSTVSVGWLTSVGRTLVCVCVCVCVCGVYIHVSWLKATSKERTYVHFPCISSERMKLIHFLTKPD